MPPLPRRTEVNYSSLFSILFPSLCSVMVLVMIWMILLVWHEPLSSIEWCSDVWLIGCVLVLFGADFKSWVEQRLGKHKARVSAARRECVSAVRRARLDINLKHPEILRSPR